MSIPNDPAWLRHWRKLCQDHDILARGVSALGKEIPDPLTPAEFARFAFTICKAEYREPALDAIFPGIVHRIDEVIEQRVRAHLEGQG